MHKGREELRRGVRDLIEVTSREMEALSGGTQPHAPAPDEAREERPDRPILKLVREPFVRPQPIPEPDAPPPEAPARAAPPAPLRHVTPEASGVHPRKGVCAAYYVNAACWEVPDAYCNQALHVCMLRDCPVYNLNREEMERRFAAKFAHLW
jgi:hypothetical protein